MTIGSFSVRRAMRIIARRHTYNVRRQNEAILKKKENGTLKLLLFPRFTLSFLRVRDPTRKSIILKPHQGSTLFWLFSNAIHLFSRVQKARGGN